MKVHIELSRAEFEAFYLSKWKIDLAGIDYDVSILAGEPSAPKAKSPDAVPTPPPASPDEPLLADSAGFPTDPKFFVNTVATIFGRTYKGGEDTGDLNADGTPSTGAFTDRRTGKKYATHNETLVGVAVPIPLFKAMIGSDYDGVSDLKYTAWVINPKTGKAAKKVRIVDLGPGEHGELLDDRYLDRTYALCAIMGDMDNTRINYAILGPDGNPMEIKGLDGPKIKL